MFTTSSNSDYDKDDFTDSQELLELVASWDKSTQSTHTDDEPEVVQIKFSEDLASYIRTGVDPTGRYGKPVTRAEKYGIALGYAFIIIMFLTGLLSGGVGRRLFEELVRFIQGR
ncbi:MAG: hypothetical protein H0X31_02085 [Nostocaceae cyanobacterium]|nr:hypothetical protein [Nostocaceae cyanobacterium]